MVGGLAGTEGIGLLPPEIKRTACAEPEETAHADRYGTKEESRQVNIPILLDPP